MSLNVTSLTLEDLGRSYRERRLRPTEVTETFLERISPGDVYLEVLADRARQQAEHAERQFDRGVDVGPLQGIPLALKDLLDVEGTVSSAGAKVLAEGPPADADCPVVARLDAAGAVFLGKTNMTEIAFSGVGMNPHYGTPPNALDQERIPGGSSSGSTVAVATGRACAALGSDTGGSVRIPAAFNRLVGLKTTDGLVPTDGTVPLSFTLDTIGPIARTPRDAWLLFRTMAALAPAQLPVLPARLRLLAPTTVVLDELDEQVAAGFERELERLRERGHEVVEGEVPLFSEMLEAVGRFGSIAAHEAMAVHGDTIEKHGARMDPRVAGRVAAVAGRPSSDYIRLMLERRRWQRELWNGTADFDAILAPTVAILPPRLRDLDEDEAYFEANRLCLRNTSLFNMAGGASLSVPAAQGPVGIMISGPPDSEGLMVAIGEALLEWQAGEG